MSIWKGERLELFKKLYPNMNNYELSWKFGVATGTIGFMAHKLGLKKSREHMEQVNKKRSAEDRKDSLDELRHPKGAKIRYIETGSVSELNGMLTHISR